MTRSPFSSELRALVALAGPIVLGQLGNVGMNTADTIMVGPLGATSLAAAGVGSAVYVFTTLIGQGVLTGMSPLVSQAFGAGDRAECRRVLIQGLWLALALSAPVAAVCLAGGPIVRLLGQTPAVAELAGGYLRALAPSVPALFLFLAFRPFLEGMNIVRPIMVITFLGLAANVAFNRLLIHGAGPIPALGVAGSGWATTAVRWIMLGALGVYVSRREDLHPFRVDVRRPAARRLARILHIGIPIGGQMGLEVGFFAFAAVMMGWLGPVPLAAHQVTINIAATTFMVAWGTSMAGSVRVGQHIGAGRTAGVRHAVTATYLVAVGCMAAFALLFLAARRSLIGLYTPDPDIIDIGSRLLLVAAVFQIFDGGQVAGVSVLRGAADTRVPTAIAGLGYWAVGVPFAYGLAFAFDAGPVGIWAGLCIGLGAVALLLGFRVAWWLRRYSEERTST